jgi:hypothetical protein
MGLKLAKKANATVTSVGSDGTFMASINVNGTYFSHEFSKKPTPSANTIITVYYTDDTPPKFSLGGNPPKYFGPLLIAAATFAIIMAIIVAYLVTVSKPFAAAYGGVQATGNALGAIGGGGNVTNR